MTVNKLSAESVMELNSFLFDIKKRKPELTININTLFSTMVHTAPEIYIMTYFKRLYIILANNVIVNVDEENSDNKFIFERYHVLIEKYLGND